MNRRFEYQVCPVALDRVAFVNEEWQGIHVLESEPRVEDLELCPTVWTYLERAGREGWELVSAVESCSPQMTTGLRIKPLPLPYQLPFLKRAVEP